MKLFYKLNKTVVHRAFSLGNLPSKKPASFSPLPPALLTLTPQNTTTQEHMFQTFELFDKTLRLFVG